MDNIRRFNGFNTSSNSHTNLNTRMPTPPLITGYNRIPHQPIGNPRTFIANGVFVNGVNRVPPPPALSNNM